MDHRDENTSTEANDEGFYEFDESDGGLSPEDLDLEAEAAESGSEAEGGADVAEGEAPVRGGPKDSTSVDELEMSLESRETDAADGAESAVTREDQLAAQIERLQAESDAHRDKWLRAMAEFENFRKRTRRELDSSLNLARASVFRQLLEVVDNFERALGAVDPESPEAGADFVKGVELIRDQLLRVLRDNDVHRIEAVGAEFDPNLHEAVSKIPSEDVPSEHIVQVVREGYQLGDLVLRPAVVVVAQ